MTLENRIIAHGCGQLEEKTEVDELVEAVYFRKRAKSGTWWFVALVGMLSFVVTVCILRVFNVVDTSQSRLFVMLSGIVGATITWLFCWPFAGRSEFCQNALDFLESIRYVERVTGKPFENWSLLDDSIEGAVNNALVYELEAICAIQEKNHIKAGDLFAKWRRRHEQMQRLFPSIKGYDELTAPVTFGSYDPEADSLVHYCSRG